MKNKVFSLMFRFRPAVWVGLAIAGLGPIEAQTTYYWDSNGVTGGFGAAAGTWAASTTGSATQGWSTDSTGGTLPGNVTTTTSDLLNFGTASLGYGAATVTVSGTVSAANLTFGAASPGVVLVSGGTIAMGSTNGVVTVNNASDTMSSVISGSGTFSKEGTGTLIYSGSGINTGAIAVNGGTLQFGTSSTGGQMLSASSISIASGAILSFNRNNSTTPGSSAGGGFTISGGGSVQQIGTGTLVLNTANSYTGGTTLTKGTIQAGNNTALGSGTFTMANVSSGTTTTIQSDSATARTIANSFGTFAGSTATYAFGSAGTGDLTFTSTTGAAIGNASRTFQVDNVNTEFDFGLLNGGVNSTITKTGAGTLILAGANTYSNTTTISAGSLQLGNGGTGGSLATTSAITNNGNLTIKQSDVVVQGTDFSASAIGGTGSLTQAGSGTTKLTAANSYSGATIVSSGTLLINGAQTNAGALSVASGGTLGGTGTIATASNAGVTFVDGAALSPGDSSASDFALTLGTGVFDISAMATSGKLLFALGSSSDKLTLTSGTLNIGTLSSSEFAFAIGSGFGAGTYTLFDTASTITSVSLDAATFSLNASFNGNLQFANSNQDIQLFVTAVPEPSTWALLASGLTAAMVLRRRGDFTSRPQAQCKDPQSLE